MNTKVRFVFILTLVLLAGVAGVALVAASRATPAQSGAPTVVSYQGEVRLDGAPYTGTGYFKFSVVNAAGNAVYWANDGTRSGEPALAVPLDVSNGLFSVLLGDTNLDGMTEALAARAFNQLDRYLRVWFSTSPGGPFSHLDPDTLIAAVPYALQAQQAADADTVDGLHAHELAAHYQNVVVVAKSGGDYTSVQAAIDSITGAAADNAYLVWVAAGVYVEQVTMVPHVHLQGAGQEATVIDSSASSSAWPPTEATLTLAGDSSLRDLTVGNGGPGQYKVALLATAGTASTLVADVTARAQGSGTLNYALYLNGSGTGVTLQRVTALAENGEINHGLGNESGATATLCGGSFTGRGGTDTYGIINYGSGATLEADGVTALGENSSDRNYGLFNYEGAAATVRGGSFTGRGGAQTLGIDNTGSGSVVTLQRVTALGESGSSENWGLYNYLGAATLRGGSITGRGGADAWGIRNRGSGATLEAEGVTALGDNGSGNNYGLENYEGAAATLRGGSFTGLGGAGALGIENIHSGTTLEADSVTALGEGGTSNYGLENWDGAAAALHGGSFTARGGTTTRGISNPGAKLESESVTALAEDATDSNYGLVNYGGAAATLRGGSFTARGGTDAYGIYNYGPGTTLEADSVTALGKHSSIASRGLRNSDGVVRLRGGSFTGLGGLNTAGIESIGSTAWLEAEGVTALGEAGSGSNYGLDTGGDAVATLRGGSFTGRMGTNAVGIDNSGALQAEGLTALGEWSSGNNCGLDSPLGTASVTQSVLEGDTNSVYGTSDVTISNSRLVWGDVSGAVTCVAVSLGTTFYANGCP